MDWVFASAMFACGGSGGFVLGAWWAVARRIDAPVPRARHDVARVRAREPVAECRCDE